MPDQATRYQQRAGRILDATTELVLPWGDQRVTIEDIAKQARRRPGPGVTAPAGRPRVPRAGPWEVHCGRP